MLLLGKNDILRTVELGREGPRQHIERAHYSGRLRILDGIYFQEGLVIAGRQLIDTISCRRRLTTPYCLRLKPARSFVMLDGRFCTLLQ